jgi:hypothetical protein
MHGDRERATKMMSDVATDMAQMWRPSEVTKSIR